MDARVLFLYVSFSSGHQRASEAIEDAFKKLYPAVETKGVNSFNYAYPVIEKVLGRTYFEILKRTPQLWGYLYDNKSILDATAEIRGLLSRLNSRKFRRLISDFSPDAVVCTQAAPCAVISKLKNQKAPFLKLVAVITDYRSHAYWVYNNVDLYIVPTKEVETDLIRCGIKKERVKILGIPIDPKFQNKGVKTKIRQSLNLNPHLVTILVMGGGQGFGPIEEILSELALVELPFQTIIIAGKNKRLYRNLKNIYQNLPFPVKLLSFTKNIDEIMEASDMIITKPGGLTSSEALVKGLPIIIVDPIPGQEERNSQFLIKNKVALRVDDENTLSEVISELLNFPSKLRQMRINALNLAKPDAAFTSAKVIMKLINSDEISYHNAENIFAKV